MSIRLRSKQWISLSIFPGLFSHDEKNFRDIPSIDSESDIKETKTGFDRVVDIFKVDEFGSPTKELLSTVHTGFFAGFVGGCVAGLKESQLKYQSFVTKLNSEMFVSHTEAKSVLTRHMAISFTKGFVHWGSRLAFFCSVFTLSTNMLSAYNNQLHLWNFVASGVIAGGIYRIPMGSRAMIAASLVGGCLGLVAGCMSVGMFKILDTSYDEIQDWHYKVRNMRHQMIEEATDQEQKEKNESPLLNDRTAILKSAALEALQDKSNENQKVSSQTK